MAVDRRSFIKKLCMTNTLCAASIAKTAVLAWTAFAALMPRCLSSAIPQDELKVSTLGFDPVDSTRFIRKALASGVRRIILDRQDGPWVSMPLRLGSNTELVLEPEVVLLAKRGEYRGKRDSLMEIQGATNVILRGGIGSTLRMWRCDYVAPPYEKAQWRAALRITHSRNVCVEGLRMEQSGGDGITIGRGSENITVRGCTCDGNHRQGISLTDGENILIEDTILSNTGGTNPQAGIDIEPDLNYERLVNISLRNCLSRGNVGNGFELYLGKLDDTSKPISVSFENCRSEGSLCGAAIHGGFSKEAHFGRGTVRFSNCVFAESRDCGIRITSVPSNSYSVSFSGCVITNSPPQGKGQDVKLCSTRLAQGPCDCVDFGDLTIFQYANREWFLSIMQALGPSPEHLSGHVTIVRPNGTRFTETINSEWAKRNMPEVGDGLPLPQKMTAWPTADSIEVVDTTPGKSVRLSNVLLVFGAPYVKYAFFVANPGEEVRFKARHVSSVPGRILGKAPILVRTATDDSKGKSIQLPNVGFDSGDIVFKASVAGFHVMSVPNCGARFLLEESTAPVAIDLSAVNVSVAPEDVAAGFPLWFDVPQNGDAVIFAGGDLNNRFAAMLHDTLDKIICTRDEIRHSTLFRVPYARLGGLWRMDFKPAARPNFNRVSIDAFGVPLFCFLSNQKYWQTRK